MAKTATAFVTSPLEEPTNKWGLSARQVFGSGLPLTKVKRLETFSADQFQLLVGEWAYYYLSSQYVEVANLGGSGDKGRDIVGYTEPSGTPRRKYDNYQCKHYDNQLAPTDFYLELGKLCYYTFTGQLYLPERYYIVASKGVGTKLHDLINDPIKLKAKLIENWAKYCQAHLVAGEQIELKDALLRHVENLDLGIVRELSQFDLLEQHKASPSHHAIFGTIPETPRQAVDTPAAVQLREQNYVSQIYSVFAEFLGRAVSSQQDIQTEVQLRDCFNDARNSYYSVETLKAFSRDNLIDTSAIDDLFTQIHNGIRPTFFNLHNSKYARMLSVYSESMQLQLAVNTLGSFVEPQDRVGICHHLANDNRISWSQ